MFGVDSWARGDFTSADCLNSEAAGCFVNEERAPFGRSG